MLELEIRSKVGINEPMDGYRLELQYRMNTYFEKILKVNNKNFEKSEKPSQDTTFHSNNPTNSESVPNLNSSDAVQNDNTEKTSHVTLVVDFKNCTHLSMSINQNNKYTILLNEFKETETPAIIGYSYTEQKFVYGNQLTWLLKKLGWNLTYYLDTDHRSSTEITVDNVYRKISFEFILSFLLRKLKFAAEEQIGSKFSSVVFIIPFWFSSTHRVKMKDGAKLAGFKKVNLVHESSCAAFACLPYTTDGNLLVITGRSNGVRAFQYNCNKTDKTVKMINYWKIHDIKFKHGVLDLVDGKDKVSKLLSKDYQKAKKSIKKGLKEAFEEIHVGTCPLPIYITETEEWKQMLNKIAQKLPHDRYQVIDYSNAVLSGALDLSTDPKIIYDCIEDFLSYDVFMKDLSTKPKICENFVCPKTPLCSQKDFITTQGCIEFLQRHEIDEKMRRVELLKVQNECSNQRARITMGICHEGIFKCQRSNAICSGEGNPSLLVSRCSPNLSEKEFSSLEIWLNELLPEISLEKFEITQNKKRLLHLCEKLTDEIKLGVLNIESRLCKMQVLDQIFEARSFAEHPNTKLDDLKGQIEILEKYQEKYSSERKPSEM